MSNVTNISDIVATAKAKLKSLYTDLDSFAVTEAGVEWLDRDNEIACLRNELAVAREEISRLAAEKVSLMARLSEQSLALAQAGDAYKRPFCKRGHLFSGENLRIRVKEINGVLYQERICCECKKLRDKGVTAAELDAMFGIDLRLS